MDKTPVTLESRARNFLAAAVGLFFPLKKVAPADLRAELLIAAAPRILLIRPHQGFGDLILATPAIRALTQAFPNSQVHLLVDLYLRPVMEFHERFKRLWVWDKKAMQGSAFLPFIRSLRRERFDLAIVLSGRIPSFTSFLFARLIGARRVLAYDTRPFYGGANWSRWLTSCEVPAPKDQTPEAVKFARLVEPITGPVQDLTPEFFIPTSAQDAVRSPRAALLPDGKRRIGIYLGGNPDRVERLWPVDHWAALARMILNDPQFFLVAVVPPPSLLSGSGSAEPGIYAEVCARLGQKLPVFHAPHLTQVAAFLQGLDLWICPDGGLLHIAVAAHVPTLGLFFLTDPKLWYYPLPWAFAVQSPQAAPASLSPETVFRALEHATSAK